MPVYEATMGLGPGVMSWWCGLRPEDDPSRTATGLEGGGWVWAAVGDRTEEDRRGLVQFPPVIGRRPNHSVPQYLLERSSSVRRRTTRRGQSHTVDMTGGGDF